MDKPYFFIQCVIALFLLSACKNDTSEQLFILKKSSGTGISFQNKLTEDASFNILNYPYYYNGGGVSIGDVNNDGLVDVFFVSNLQKNKLYLNQGEMKFVDVTEKAGVGGQYDWSTGSNIVDINGDGFLDIYVCNLGSLDGKKGKNELFLNNGDGTFNEVAAEFNLDFKTFATQSCFFDYDNDGDLDVYLLNHAIHTMSSYVPRDKVANSIDGMSGDRLMKNNLDKGQKSFTDITSESGIQSSPVGFGLGIVASDINNDGWMDIYVANDFHENDYLYINGKDGTFSNKLKEWIGHTSKYSMGVDINDFNNDGLPDIMTLDMLPEKAEVLQKSISEDDYRLRETILEKGYAPQLSRNTLQLNRGDYFSDVAPYLGVEATDWSWSPLMADFDNDGFKDLYITNGIYRRPNDLDYLNYTSNSAVQAVIGQKNPSISKKLIALMPQLKISNKTFVNKKGVAFEDNGKNWGLDIPSYSNGAAYADLDNDGDLDLVINNINEEAFVFENISNKAPDKNSYLSVSFTGANLNTTGIGAKVFLKNGNSNQFQEHLPTRGFMSSTEQGVHFGLEKATEVDSLWIVWPTGSFQLMTNVAVNQTIQVDEQKASGNYYEVNMRSAMSTIPFFTQTTDNLTEFIHEENSFNDINYEYLIPKTMAKDGPGLAVGDVNGDGLEDIFISNAQNKIPQLYIQGRDNSFTISNENTFYKDSIYEGVDALFFDADQDKDLDLYVASAGNELKPGDIALADRLYINNGVGNFTRNLEALPPLYGNSSCVEAADFDKDGDIDLFVGGRVVSGRYGISPESYILENNGKGKFSKVDLPEELSHIGMVTDAKWTDFNGDGYIDIIAVGEWMPITLIENQKGSFSNATPKALENTEGWWNTIITDDFDNDGDIDFMAGNLGLNTRLNASVEEPVHLYLKDFDDNGSLDPILTHYIDGKEYPFATKDLLSKQMNFLKKRFTSYNSFSGTTMDDLFGPELLKDAEVKKASEFQSLYIENLGGDNFAAHPLPKEVNFAPVMSMVSKDLDEDGLKDVVLAGNFYDFNPGMGRQDASRGLLLLNKGDNQFVPEPLENSGLDIKGQVRNMELIVTGDGSEILVIAQNNEGVDMFKLNSKL